MRWSSNWFTFNKLTKHFKLLLPYQNEMVAQLVVPPANLLPKVFRILDNIVIFPPLVATCSIYSDKEDSFLDFHLLSFVNGFPKNYKKNR